MKPNVQLDRSASGTKLPNQDVSSTIAVRADGHDADSSIWSRLSQADVDGVTMLEMIDEPVRVAHDCGFPPFAEVKDGQIGRTGRRYFSRCFRADGHQCEIRE
jgi:hypothetical protein